MRLLFAHPRILVPGNHIGAIKSFRALIAALADRGHDCEVVTTRGSSDPDVSTWGELSSLTRAGVSDRVRVTGTTIRGACSARTGVHFVGGMRDDWRFLSFVRRRAAAFAPEWILCENGTVDLRIASMLFPNKLVVGVTTTASLPFGPRSAARHPSLSAPFVYRRVPKMHCVSRYVQSYLREHANRDSIIQPQLAYGKRPFSTCARFADGVVTMVNPAPHKGGALFARLARGIPEQRFRAVATYAEIPPELRRIPNVEIVAARDDVGSVLTGTKVLLVPSMWGEAWGMISVDAMLRGIPVIASNDGGLPESTLGVGECLPITPGRLTRLRNGEVRFEAPPPPIAPWLGALQQLLGDRDVWEKRSRASTDAAAAYVERLSVNPLCEYLGI